MKYRVTLLLSVLLAFTGCITVNVPLGGGETAPSFQWELRWDTPRESGDVLFSNALRIKDLDASGSYQLSGMVVKQDDGTVIESSTNRWVSRPGAMLSEMLSRDLLASRNYPAVFRTAASVNNLLTIEGYIREFGATRVDSLTWIAVLDVDVTLLGDRGAVVLMQQNYRYERRMDEPGFKPLADQMSVLGSLWSEAVMSDIAAVLVHR